jgi:hypothetical protein
MAPMPSTNWSHPLSSKSWMIGVGEVGLGFKRLPDEQVGGFGKGQSWLTPL